MSEFLNHLVAKSFAAADVVRPRTALLFEPDPTQAPTPHAGPSLFVADAPRDRSHEARDLTGHAPGEWTIAVTEAQRLGAVSETEEPIGLVMAPRVDAKGTQSPPKPMVRFARRKVHEPEYEEPEDREHEHRDDLPVAASFTEIARPRDGGLKFPHRRVKDNDHKDNASSGEGAGLDIALQSLPPEQARRSDVRLDASDGRSLAPEHEEAGARWSSPLLAPKPGLAVRPPHAATTPIPTTPETNIARRQARVGLELPGARSGRRRPDAEPTIEITIGRIEVRAEPAPARAPTRRNSAAMPMNLDEYMRQRAGKER